MLKITQLSEHQSELFVRSYLHLRSTYEPIVATGSLFTYASINKYIGAISMYINVSVFASTMTRIDYRRYRTGVSGCNQQEYPVWGWTRLIFHLLRSSIYPLSDSFIYYGQQIAHSMTQTFADCLVHQLTQLGPLGDNDISDEDHNNRVVTWTPVWAVAQDYH